MKRTVESAVLSAGNKMGIATLAETVHCCVGFAGILVSVAFGFVGLTYF